MDSPRFVTHPTPETLVLRNDGDGCMTVLGVFTVLPGVAAIVIGVAVLLRGPGDLPLWQILLGLGVALAFPLVFTGVCWFRIWLHFDRTACTLAERWGVLVAWQTKAPEDLSPFSGVRLTYFPPGLTGRLPIFRITPLGNGMEREVWQSNTDEEAHAVAIDLARFLHLPLQNVTTPDTAQK